MLVFPYIPPDLDHVHTWHLVPRAVHSQNKVPLDVSLGYVVQHSFHFFNFLIFSKVESRFSIVLVRVVGTIVVVP